jgi:hypothetical protein
VDTIEKMTELRCQQGRFATTYPSKFRSYFFYEIDIDQDLYFFLSSSLVNVALSTNFTHSNQLWRYNKANGDIYRWNMSCNAMPYNAMHEMIHNWCFVGSKSLFLILGYSFTMFICSNSYVLWGSKLFSLILGYSFTMFICPNSNVLWGPTYFLIYGVPIFLSWNNNAYTYIFMWLCPY